MATCKRCNSTIPIRAYHPANQIALDHGHCSWICFHSANEEKALELFKQRTADLKRRQEEIEVKRANKKAYNYKGERYDIL